MADSFAQRLAYMRWIRSIGRLKPETDRELAAALGVGEKWLSKWKNSDASPEGRSEALAIAQALGSTGFSVDWLYDGQGEPPQPALWRLWLGRRTAPTVGIVAAAVAPASDPSWKRAAKKLGGEIAQGSAERPGAKGRPNKKAAGDRRRKK